MEKMPIRSVHSSITNTKDGWNNVLRGLGGSRDTTQTTYYQKSNLLSMFRQSLNDLYSTNWIAGKCVDIPIDDALKDDRIFQCENPDTLQTFLDGLEDFKIDEKIKMAFKWAKVFGGSVMVIVSKDDKMDKPLIIENMKQGDLKNIAILDKFDVFSTLLDRDPLSKRYLEPEYYQLTRNGGYIHYSRIIKIDGSVTTNYNKELNQGWGFSIYERAYKTIMNASVSPDLLNNILMQSNTDVFKILGLNESLVQNEDSLIIKRLETIMQTKSIFNGIALDKEDEYTNIAKTYTGLDSLNREFYQIVAGAFDIPYTRFMGTSATGMNATGEGDLSNYYDKLQSERDFIAPSYKTIDKILQMHLFGELKNIKFEWDSLWQLSELEIADLQNKQAQTDQTYFNMGVINEIDIKSRLVLDSRYPTITAESVEEDKKLLEEMESAENFDYNENAAK